MEKLTAKEILNETKWRIESLLEMIDHKQKQYNIDKSQIEDVKEIVEMEVNNILNIAFQNKNYFEYSKFDSKKNILPDNYIGK